MRHKLTIALVAAVFSALTGMSYAQSGSSAPPPPPPPSTGGGGGGPAATGGGATGGGDAAGAETSDAAALTSALSGSGVSGGGSLQAGVLSGQSSVIRSVAQANYLNALGAKEVEQARRAYLENRRLLWEQQREYEAWKQQQKEERKSRYAKKREERKLDKMMEEIVMTSPGIEWPKALQSNKYSDFRTEIEALSELYARLDEKKGVELGLETAIRNLARMIIEDEKSGLIDQKESKDVRRFVIDLNRNKAQNHLMNAMKSKEFLTSTR